MLLPYLPILNSKCIILGSQSMSRHELLCSQQLHYERVASTFAQDLDKKSFASPEEYNMATCRGKVDELIARFTSTAKQWDLLICADTIVHLDGNIIEKPENEQHCIEMMGKLANRTHMSYTAHVIVFNQGKYHRHQWVSKAEVTLGQITEEVLVQFAKQKEPYIHSGGYQLNGISSSFLASIKGNHSSVQGLDIHELCKQIIAGSRAVKWIV